MRRAGGLKFGKNKLSQGNDFRGTDDDNGEYLDRSSSRNIDSKNTIPPVPEEKGSGWDQFKKDLKSYSQAIYLFFAITPSIFVAVKLYVGLEDISKLDTKTEKVNEQLNQTNTAVAVIQNSIMTIKDNLSELKSEREDVRYLQRLIDDLERRVKEIEKEDINSSKEDNAKNKS